MLVFKSTVDATVSNDALVDRLMMRLPPTGHELVLFDINRVAQTVSLMRNDPGAFTERLLRDGNLPFALTLISNTDTASRSLSIYRKPPFASELGLPEPLGAEWPPGIFSLSHVALPIPPDDPLYGETPPADRNALFLGNIPIKGEKNVLAISSSFLLRLRSNPFYSYLEKRTVDWIEAAD